MMSQYIICHGIDLLDLEDFSKIFNICITCTPPDDGGPMVTISISLYVDLIGERHFGLYEAKSFSEINPPYFAISVAIFFATEPL